MNFSTESVEDIVRYVGAGAIFIAAIIGVRIAFSEKGHTTASVRESIRNLREATRRVKRKF